MRFHSKLEWGTYRWASGNRGIWAHCIIMLFWTTGNVHFFFFQIIMMAQWFVNNYDKNYHLNTLDQRQFWILYFPPFSPGYGIRFFHPWILTLHTGWKVVFCKARYIRINKKFVSKETKALNMEKYLKKSIFRALFFLETKFFWKLGYSPTQKSCFHPVCRVGIHEWDLGFLQKLCSWLIKINVFLGE